LLSKRIDQLKDEVTIARIRDRSPAYKTYARSSLNRATSTSPAHPGGAKSEPFVTPSSSLLERLKHEQLPEFVGGVALVEEIKAPLRKVSALPPSMKLHYISTDERHSVGRS
jgi:hypothetical protein